MDLGLMFEALFDKKDNQNRKRRFQQNHQTLVGQLYLLKVYGMLLEAQIIQNRFDNWLYFGSHFSWIPAPFVMLFLACDL